MHVALIDPSRVVSKMLTAGRHTVAFTILVNRVAREAGICTPATLSVGPCDGKQAAG